MPRQHTSAYLKSIAAGLVSCLTTATLVTVAAPAAHAVGGVHFTDIGPLDSSGTVLQVNPAGDVGTNVGRWHNGAFTAAPQVQGASPGIGAMTITDMAPDGTMVGWSFGPLRQGYYYNQHAATWRVGSSTPTFAAAFDDELAGPAECGSGGSDTANTVSPTGEIGGFGIFNFRNPDSRGCENTADAIGFVAPESAATHTQVPQVPSIIGLNGSWAVGGPGASSNAKLLNRGTGQVTALGLTPVTPHGLSANGTVIGAVSNGSQNVPTYQVPGGQPTPLKLPAGAREATAYAINASGEIVGEYNRGIGLIWPSPTSDPIMLDSLPAVPAGWSIDEGRAIDDNGDVGADASNPNGDSEDVIFSGALGNDLSATVTLTAPDGSPFTGGASSTGSTLVATVTLTAAAGAAAPITGIAAAPPLSVTPSSKLTLASGPTPAAPAGGWTLSPGASTSYAETFTVVGTGTAQLAVNATGTEAGVTQEASAQAVARLAQPLSVTVSWLQNGNPIVLAGNPDRPDTIRLADTDDGEVAQDVTAVVTVTNTSPVLQQNVSINGNPALSYHVAAQATQALPVAITAGPTPSGTLPDLSPGESKPISYSVHVSNNGSFDLTAQVLSSDAGSSGTNISQGVGTITAVPTALLWLSLHKVGTGSVRAGTQVGIRGTLTNRSLTQSLDVAPLEPSTVTGNAGGGRLVDDTSAANLLLSYLADGVQLPFYGAVKPGQTIDLAGEVDTSYVPATRATLSYKPSGQVVNDDGSKSDLTPTQIGQGAGTSPVSVAINTTDPAVPAATVGSTVSNFTDGAVQGGAAWAAGNLRGALAFLQHPVTGSAAAVKGVAKAVVNTPRDLAGAAWILGSAEIYATCFVALTPAQRTSFETSILRDFDASSLKKDNEEASKSVAAGLTDFENAAFKGDYNTLARLAGSGVASGGGAVADAVLTDVFFQKLALGLKATSSGAKSLVKGQLANDLVLADKLRDAKLAKTVIKTIDSVKAGQNLLLNKASALVNAWGLNPSQITALQKFCKENDIIVAVRSRSKKAADLIKRGLAVGKNEVLKLKGVNEIDTKFLGYSSADLNKLIFAEPITLADVYKNLHKFGADAQTRALVLERYDLRLEEWTSPKVRGVMEKANAAKEIEWGFNGADNGAPEADRLAKRRFSLYERKGVEMPGTSKARSYQEVLVGDKEGLAGKLVSVTQDVDVAAILSSNGEILSAALRSKVYAYLSDALGIEHPETVSWISDGEILFQAKYKELSRLTPGGGEALAVFGPDGSASAGFLNPALTVYNSATKGGVVFFHGGYNNPYAKLITSVRVNLKKFL